ncbi:hypothetical protein VNO77_01426 [Canavalia gladiata]|uniref:Uncharacterized protein n=1 Tax=Canavalia gladiata TaxID=3824 RepID=A0AAN9R587_CANGL
MANPPFLQEDCVKYNKPKDHTPKAKGLSFSAASILSLIIYITIFYILNLSPYTLFNNHIFWFLMSNTLILIIAADYGAFSSSKQKHLYDEEYHVSSYVPKYQRVDKKCITPKQEVSEKMLKEINKYTITKNIDVPERLIEVVAQNDPKKHSEYSNEKKLLPPLLDVDDSFRACERKPIPVRIYKRSKSDRSHRIKRVVIDESVKRMRKPTTMEVEAKVEEENEFTTMTNEELNRRVEEFIMKFNRQIRLQAIRNIYQIDEE